jgi:uncharacterized protein YjbI with pentapeptide repeats
MMMDIVPQGLFCSLKEGAVKSFTDAKTGGIKECISLIPENVFGDDFNPKLQTLAEDCLTLSPHAKAIVTKRTEALKVAWEKLLTENGFPVQPKKLSREAEDLKATFTKTLKIGTLLTNKVEREVVMANADKPPSLKEMQRMSNFLNDETVQSNLVNYLSTNHQASNATALELIKDLKRSTLKEAFNSPAFRTQLEASLKDTVTHGNDFEFAQFKPTVDGHMPVVSPADLNLVEANMRYTDVSGLDLAGKYLSGTDFRHANLAGSNLTDTQLQSTQFQHANLRGTNFSLPERNNQKPVNCIDLTGADLEGSQWRNRRVTSDAFDSNKLTHVDLSGSEFRPGKGLYGSDLTTTNLSGATMHDWSMKGNKTSPLTNFTGADLTGLKAEDLNLANHQLSGANLTDANLHGAVLPHTDLSGANLQGADLRQSHMQGANLDGATITPSTQLYGAKLTSLANENVPLAAREQITSLNLDPNKAASLNGTIFEEGSVLDNVDFRGATFNPNLTDGEAPLLKSSTFYDADVAHSYPLDKVDGSPEGFRWDARRAYHNPPPPTAPAVAEIESTKKGGFLGRIFGNK